MGLTLQVLFGNRDGPSCWVAGEGNEKHLRAGEPLRIEIFLEMFLLLVDLNTFMICFLLLERSAGVETAGILESDGCVFRHCLCTELGNIT